MEAEALTSFKPTLMDSAARNIRQTHTLFLSRAAIVHQVLQVPSHKKKKKTGGGILTLPEVQLLTLQGQTKMAEGGRGRASISCP